MAALPITVAETVHDAFGYDLMLGFDPVKLRHRRSADNREVVAFVPAAVVAVDPARGTAIEARYAFHDGVAAESQVYQAFREPRMTRPTPTEPDPQHYRDGVRAALRAFHAGDMFEAVLSHTFTQPTLGARPSAVFARLLAANPSRYGFLLNLGRGEVLVGASPEMFVRVTGDLVETCPISGTVARATLRSRTPTTSCACCSRRRTRRS